MEERTETGTETGTETETGSKTETKTETMTGSGVALRGCSPSTELSVGTRRNHTPGETPPNSHPSRARRGRVSERRRAQSTRLQKTSVPITISHYQKFRIIKTLISHHPHISQTLNTLPLPLPNSLLPLPTSLLPPPSRSPRRSIP